MIEKLTLDQLKVLVTIADEGSFTSASKKLRRAQSSISQTISALEHVQDVLIFDRSSRRPTITPVGQTLVEQARVVLSNTAKFEAIAKNNKRGIEPELNIAIDPLVPISPCLESLEEFNNVFPDVKLHFHSQGLGGAENLLKEGKVSIAFCTLLPKIPSGFDFQKLASITLVPVVATKHPIARKSGKVTVSELNEHLQLVLSHSNQSDEPNYGILGKRQWKFVELNRRLDFLLAGFGWCRMPIDFVKPYIKDGSLKILNITDDPYRDQPPLNIYAAFLKDKPLGVAGFWLVDKVRSIFE